VGHDEYGTSDGPPSFGMPEHSALTIEGRIERAAAVGDHIIRVREGRERPLWRSDWLLGLLLIAGALGAVVALAVVLDLLG